MPTAIHFEINPERARISFGELGTELPTYHAAVANDAGETRSCWRS